MSSPYASYPNGNLIGGTPSSITQDDGRNAHSTMASPAGSTSAEQPSPAYRSPQVMQANTSTNTYGQGLSSPIGQPTSETPRSNGIISPNPSQAPEQTQTPSHDTASPYSTPAPFRTPTKSATNTPAAYTPANSTSTYSYNGSASVTPAYGGASARTPFYSTPASSVRPQVSSPYPAYNYDFSSPSPQQKDTGLRRRGAAAPSPFTPMSLNGERNSSPQKKVVQNLDFMFPKVDKEYTVQTKSGGVATLVAYGLIVILALAETITWRAANGAQTEHISVDTSLGKKMRVNMNITFPALACEDLHLDAIDVAGDSQIDIDDTLVKKRLHRDGSSYSKEEIEVETNFHSEQQSKKEKIIKDALPENYCGPCFGAHSEEGQCCQTCDEVIEAYNKKRWKTDMLRFTAEQCVREGRDKIEPKKMTKGQGCNLSGYMTVNRVSGNFHIAMGEGIERDGRHIHTFLPEDSPNFNASHIIHHMSFGPEDGSEPLNGVTKVVTEDTGVTGLFQYFIKVVPTTYVGDQAIPDTMKASVDSLPSLYKEVEDSKQEGARFVETNRYFFTERYRPLMTELHDEHERDESNHGRVAANAGHGGDYHTKDHHYKKNAVLPGVFFIYEIYPFAVEISRESVPLSHLLVRLFATIGGVFTLVRWLDAAWYAVGGGDKGTGTGRTPMKR